MPAPVSIAASRAPCVMMTMAQLCARLSVHRSTVIRLIERGALPRPIKLSPARSGKLRWDVAAVEAAIAELQTNATG